jgi:excisionase family DNA binding protein
MQEELLTVEEAAARRGLKPPSIYKAVHEGRLPARRVLGRIAIRAADVDAYQSQRGGFRPGAGRKTGKAIGATGKEQPA